MLAELSAVSLKLSFFFLFLKLSPYFVLFFSPPAFPILRASGQFRLGGGESQWLMFFLKLKLLDLILGIGTYLINSEHTPKCAEGTEKCCLCG